MRPSTIEFCYGTATELADHLTVAAPVDQNARSGYVTALRTICTKIVGPHPLQAVLTEVIDRVTEK